MIVAAVALRRSSRRSRRALPQRGHIVVLSGKDAKQELGEVDGSLAVIIEGLEDAKCDLLGHTYVHQGHELLELLEAQLVVPILVQAPEHAHEAREVHPDLAIRRRICCISKRRSRSSHTLVKALPTMPMGMAMYKLDNSNEVMARPGSVTGEMSP
eukprot:CAMPEP_0176152810 /NCGR_PEP_ID=MMETSP0120_2-20121206/78050_1 /TAXON_ID=160619 /ORGANISM="Kryptoperidinium foliaceum, Strain CCMP 1326" /LENGTH=155 /DNA_ID=CAMNT_0017489833 /DNA_START=197 /DNA_END=665 /DNA_ORIENTATION=+